MEKLEDWLGKNKKENESLVRLDVETERKQEPAGKKKSKNEKVPVKERKLRKPKGSKKKKQARAKKAKKVDKSEKVEKVKP